jgi:hypothetical protein
MEEQKKIMNLERVTKDERLEWLPGIFRRQPVNWSEVS